MIDFDLDITTDQGTFSSSLSIPLGREAKTTAFRDDVEAGVNGWTAAGEWHQATGRSVGAGHSWYFGRENGPPLGNAYDNNAAGDLTSPPFNLSGASSAELVFDTYLARELCCDFATVSASADGFATSTLLGSLDPSVDPAFSEVRLDLSTFAGKRAVQVRFTFMSDASVAFEGWYVDNIRVEQMTFDCQGNTAGSQLCSTDADCDDGNPGTADQCAGGACVHPCAQGFAGADCALREALMSPLCQSERIDPQLERLIESKLTTADALVGRAQLTNRPTRARSIIRRADRALATISRRARTAKKARRISAACAQMIENRITDLRRRVMALRR